MRQTWLHTISLNTPHPLLDFAKQLFSNGWIPHVTFFYPSQWHLSSLKTSDRSYARARTLVVQINSLQDEPTWEGVKAVFVINFFLRSLLNVLFLSSLNKGKEPLFEMYQLAHILF